MKYCKHKCERCGQGAAVMKHEATYSRFACTVCGHRFNVPLDQVGRDKHRPGKSGVIAGRITIPGYRYGSSRLV